MQPTIFEHPTEEALERFVMNRSGEEELETVETHILACDSCVARVELLEAEIADIRVAAAQVRQESLEKELLASKASWRSWFTVPRLSWAGAAAVLALGIAVIPQFTHRVAPVAEVSLTAYRGLENPTVPAGERLHFHLNAADLPQSTIRIDIVDDQGSNVWKGTAQVTHDQAEITAPSLKPGTHYLRLYDTDTHQNELLREFAFEVK